MTIKEYKGLRFEAVRRHGPCLAGWRCVECLEEIPAGDELWFQITHVSRYSENWKGHQRKIKPREEIFPTCAACAAIRQRSHDRWLNAGFRSSQHYPAEIGKLHELHAREVEEALAKGGNDVSSGP